MLTKTKIDHPNAWTTDSVCSKSDVAYPLSKMELADLDQALCTVKAHGPVSYPHLQLPPTPSVVVPVLRSALTNKTEEHTYT